MTDMRSDFELWARSEGYNLTRHTSGEGYAFAPARAAWAAWQYLMGRS